MRGLNTQDGPLMLSDVEIPGEVREWSEEALGKIERRALHELWMRGEIMIRSRKGFQKVFDLPGRVLPPKTELGSLRSVNPLNFTFAEPCVPWGWLASRNSLIFRMLNTGVRYVRCWQPGRNGGKC